MVTLTPNTKENIKEFLDNQEDIKAESPFSGNSHHSLHKYTKSHNLKGDDRGHLVMTPKGGELVALIVTDRNTGEVTEVNCKEWVLKAATHAMN